MKRQNVGVLYWAFFLSLCLHLSLAPLAQNIKVTDADKPVPIISLDSPQPKATMPPTPPPTPKPRDPVKPSAPHQPSVVPHPILPSHPDKPTAFATGAPVVTRTDDPGPGPGDIGPGTVSLTSSPEPTPSPKPVCSAPFVDATTLEKYTPDTPEAVREAGITGTAQVRVDLSSTGTVLEASIAVSSGNSSLDSAALTAAKRTTYAPKVVDCLRVPGSYLFRVEFDNN